MNWLRGRACLLRVSSLSTRVLKHPRGSCLIYLLDFNFTWPLKPENNGGAKGSRAYVRRSFQKVRLGVLGGDGAAAVGEKDLLCPRQDLVEVHLLDKAGAWWEICTVRQGGRALRQKRAFHNNGLGATA